MNVAQKLVEYLRASKDEVKKVSWPSRKDTIRYSALVIGASVVMAAFFAGLDSGFQAMWNYIITQKTTAANQIQVNQQPTATNTSVQVQSQPAQSPTTTPTPDLNGAKPIQTPSTNPSKK
jgi:preprotein translocase subunit SecE